MKERTLAIIKPDAIERNFMGEIMFHVNNYFAIKNLEFGILSEETAEQFYAEHTQKPFFKQMISFICQGPLLILELEGENVVSQWREMIGSTNPKDAEPTTLRKKYGISIDQNSFHGSDSVENAKKRNRIVFFLME